MRSMLNAVPMTMIALTLCSPLYLMAAVPLYKAPVNILHKGVTLQATRIIYPESDESGVSFSLINNSDIAYLIQSRVVPLLDNNKIEKISESPFLVLPPLQRLSPSEKISLKVMLVRKELPHDRESAFKLMVKVIPAQSNEKNKNEVKNGHLLIATQYQLKIFYRPNELPKFDDEYIANKLTFKRVADGLLVINPTPYYVTFAKLSLAGESVDKNSLNVMVEPYSHQNYSLRDRDSGLVSWQLVNRYGQLTKQQERMLP